MIKIAFVDFWDGFNKTDNFITDSFRRVCDVNIVEAGENPDILVYSIFGYENLLYNEPVRLYYTGENDVPNFNLCDYAISFNKIDFHDRHLCLPFYVIRESFDMLRKNKRLSFNENKNGFASFVVSNNFCSSPDRNLFFNELAKYKFVASGGRYANNIGGPVENKLEFINKYKFNIAFENSKVNDYITEKIFDALAANTIPIYWGDKSIKEHVNPKSFINIDDYNSIEEAIEFIKYLDNNEDLYNEMINQDSLVQNNFIEWEKMLDNFLLKIVGNLNKFVPEFGLGGQMMKNKLEKEELFHSEYLRKILRGYKRLKRVVK